MEDFPLRTFSKKVSCPIPQPEVTPRPVTTTRCLVAEREVVVRVVVGVWGRMVKAAMPVVVQRRRFRGAESLMVVCLMS